MEEYAIGTASHGQQLYALLSQDNPPQSDTLVLVGGVAYGGGTLRLEGTLPEARSIAGLWTSPDDVSLLQGSSATEAALRKKMPGSRYVHLATHGFLPT